jgi:hypothetical protein
VFATIPDNVKVLSHDCKIAKPARAGILAVGELRARIVSDVEVNPDKLLTFPAQPLAHLTRQSAGKPTHKKE